MGAQLRTPLKRFEHYDSIVPRDLRGRSQPLGQLLKKKRHSGVALPRKRVWQSLTTRRPIWYEVSQYF